MSNITISSKCSCQRCINEWKRSFALCAKPLPSPPRSCGKEVHCPLCKAYEKQGTNSKCPTCNHLQTVPKCGELIWHIPYCKERSSNERWHRRINAVDCSNQKCKCDDTKCNLCKLDPWTTIRTNKATLSTQEYDDLGINVHWIDQCILFGLQKTVTYKLCKECINKQ